MHHFRDAWVPGEAFPREQRWPPTSTDLPPTHLPEHQSAQAFHPLLLARPRDSPHWSVWSIWPATSLRMITHKTVQEDMTGSLPKASREQFPHRESGAHQKQYGFLLWGTVCMWSLETGSRPHSGELTESKAKVRRAGDKVKEPRPCWQLRRAESKCSFMCRWKHSTPIQTKSTLQISATSLTPWTAIQIFKKYQVCITLLEVFSNSTMPVTFSPFS